MFAHIKAETCPHCKAIVREDRRWGLHCNGHWNESREFECGGRMVFCPNFESKGVYVEKACPKTAAEKERRRKRESLLNNLRAAIAQADVDKTFQEALSRALQYVSTG